MGNSVGEEKGERSDGQKGNWPKVQPIKCQKMNNPFKRMKKEREIVRGNEQ